MEGYTNKEVTTNKNILGEEEVVIREDPSMKDDKVFIPHELKTLEVDVEKKLFRVNGEDFGKDCSEFSISCNSDGWRIRMEMEARVVYEGFSRTGTLTSKTEHRRSH